MLPSLLYGFETKVQGGSRPATIVERLIVFGIFLVVQSFFWRMLGVALFEKVVVVPSQGVRFTDWTGRTREVFGADLLGRELRALGGGSFRRYQVATDVGTIEFYATVTALGDLIESLRSFGVAVPDDW